MKASLTFAMVFTIMASSSSALPPPTRIYVNATGPYMLPNVTVEAREETDVPSCSVPCIQNAIEKVTECHVTDYACACKYHSEVTAAATSCVVGSCGLRKAIKVVVPAVRKMCEEAAKKDEEKTDEKVKRELEVVEEEEEDEDDEDDDDEDDDDEDEDEDEEDDDELDEVEHDEVEALKDEEKKGEKVKRQLIVPDKEDYNGVEDLE